MLQLRRIRIPAMAVVLLSVATLWADEKKKETVTGTIEFQQKPTFARETIAEVKILDVSLADAPAVTIGMQTIKNLKEGPIPFAIPYDPGLIKPGHRYSLGVRITTKGRLDYINDTSIPILANGAPSKNVKAPVKQIKR